jgi:uncharacterized protein YoxC
MNEIPFWWLILSAVFYVAGIAMFAGLLYLALTLRQVVLNLQPSISNISTKVEGVTTTLNALTHKVEGITEKVDGIADTVRGVADSAKSVADTARSTVESVGNRATQLVSNLTDRAEETLGQAEGSKFVNTVMMGFQVYNAIRHMREGKNGQVVKAEGRIEVDRGVEQSGSSSGS